MARSFSNTKVLSGLMTKAINGRGFAAAAVPQGVVRKGGAVGAARVDSDGMVTKTGEEIVASNTGKVSWVPDPRTGFYRPENVAEDVDVAGLRASLLKKH